MLLRFFVAGTALLCSAAPAAAGTATSTQFDAAPGEANVVSVTIADEEIVWVDQGAPLTAKGSSCTNTSANEVRCPRSEEVEIELGDLDDSFTASQDFYYVLTVYGREGNDVLRGAFGGDLISGGPGDDELHGGDSPDHLLGGGGRDSFFGGGSSDVLQDDDVASGDASGGPDSFDGGPGRDTIRYDDRPRSEAIRIDLARKRAAGDVLSSIENAVGGAGGDVIVGTSGRNEIFGGPEPGGKSHDVVRAGGAYDYIFAAAGSRIDAGAGNDTVDISGRRSRAATITCGPGRDVVQSRPVDRLERDCDLANLPDAASGDAYLALGMPGRLSSTGLVFDALCSTVPLGLPPDQGARVSCGGKLELRRTNGRLLGSGRFKIRGPDRGPTRLEVVVLLDPDERALIRAGLQIRVSEGKYGFTMLHR